MRGLRNYIEDNHMLAESFRGQPMTNDLLSSITSRARNILYDYLNEGVFKEMLDVNCENHSVDSMQVLYFAIYDDSGDEILDLRDFVDCPLMRIIRSRGQYANQK